MKSVFVLVARFIRSTAYFMCLFVATSWLVVTSPLNLLNPFLRWAGVPARYFPSNLNLRFSAKVLLLVGGVWQRTRICDRSDRQSCRLVAGDAGRPCVVMYTHTSNLDPILVLALCPVVPKFIYKKELRRIPLFGWCLFLYRHVSIDRRRREAAIGSLDAAVAAVQSAHQSIAIAPEGTRSADGSLQSFKRGPFHMASQAGVPIVPTVIDGAFDTLRPHAFLFGLSDITVTFLEPIIPTPSDTVDDLQKATFGAISGCIDAKKKKNARNRSQSVAAEWLATVPASAFLLGAVAVVYVLV